MIPIFKATPTNDLELEFDDGDTRRKVTLRCRKIEHALGNTNRLSAICDMLTSAVQPVELKK